MKEYVKKNKVLVVGIIALVIVLSLVIIINTTSKKLNKDNEYNNSYKPNYDEELNLGDILFNSTNVNYDNTNSGLSSTTVKEAIDELYDTILQKECAPGYVTQNTIAGYYECKIPPICKAVRDASDLHTATCSQTADYCYADGYYASGSKGTTTITYGTIWDGESALKAGDAFDCDVNGNGIVDTDANGKSTERFYYVSPYFNTDTQTFDDTTGYATLIYYRNYKNGSPSDAGVSYSTGDNWHGPNNAATHLPTTTSWSNITLKNTSRAILAEYKSTHNSTTASGNTLPTAFSYAGKAARLITAQELMRGCNFTQVKTSVTEISIGHLSRFNFLFEKTKYESSSMGSYGYWLETPHASTSGQVVDADARYRSTASNYWASDSDGVRPTIDVPYVGIVY